VIEVPLVVAELAVATVRANDMALAFYLDHGWLEVSSGVGEDGAICGIGEVKPTLR
jgi:hypothetical protein